MANPVIPSLAHQMIRIIQTPNGKMSDSFTLTATADPTVCPWRFIMGCAPFGGTDADRIVDPDFTGIEAVMLALPAVVLIGDTPRSAANDRGVRVTLTVSACNGAVSGDMGDLFYDDIPRFVMGDKDAAYHLILRIFTVGINDAFETVAPCSPANPATEERGPPAVHFVVCVSNEFQIRVTTSDPGSSFESIVVQLDLGQQKAEFQMNALRCVADVMEHIEKYLSANGITSGMLQFDAPGWRRWFLAVCEFTTADYEDDAAVTAAERTIYADTLVVQPVERVDNDVSVKSASR